MTFLTQRLTSKFYGRGCSSITTVLLSKSYTALLWSNMNTVRQVGIITLSEKFFRNDRHIVLSKRRNRSCYDWSNALESKKLNIKKYPWLYRSCTIPCIKPHSLYFIDNNINRATTLIWIQKYSDCCLNSLVFHRVSSSFSFSKPDFQYLLGYTLHHIKFLHITQA